ncbi:MAG TPA: cupin domain-containing protein [Trebonia sp.]|nr:cupin domain-containing protein [Trebonia sp.]
MVAAPSRPAIVNPISGERITILEAGTGDDVLVWELLLAPGGRVPSGHVHPRQEETFMVREGCLRLRVGWRRLLAGPGDTVVVAPGRSHHFANPGPVPARVEVRTSPALRMADLLETAAALARRQHAAGGRLPGMADTARFMRDFEAEVAAPVVPGLVRRAARILAGLAEARTARGSCGNHVAR